MSITAAMVKELREKSGAGMMDAKKALVENNGDMEAAIDWLRTKGLAKAAKKSGRTAAEGLVSVVTSGTKGAVVEVNAETDFVSRNAEFQAAVKKITSVALETSSVEELAEATVDGKSVKETLTDLIATIGENMALRRSEVLEVSQGAVVAYVHSALTDGMGGIGVLVALESSADDAVLQDLGKKIAMHVAATNPAALDRDSVDPEMIERERNVLIEQAKESGKPQEIAEKMVAGRINKYYSEICLTEQAFVMDPDNKVADVVAAAGKDAGAEIALKGFVRFQLGEGIEVEEEDFSAEVAKVVNG
ncbi:MAG: elongation factor Ts [Alphaproteobacteria bacterium]|nr:elongation factor Ts [Alphaproteobacteria bacterium]|tara:strand:- start:5977 stop:6891 length:915 start_codon:yes stop_codon:yes gene_type:complete